MPLLWWTLKDSAFAKSLTNIVVSSDSDRILDSARECADLLGINRIETARRSSELAQDDTSTEAVIEYVLMQRDVKPDVIVLLQPTSPIRSFSDIDEAVNKLVDRNLDSLLSVVPSHTFVWQQIGDAYIANYEVHDRPRRQDFSQYEENGSIYAFTMEHWNREHNRLGGKMGLYQMPEESRYQIDTPLDLYIVSKTLEIRLGTFPIHTN